MPKILTVDQEFHNARFDRWFKINVLRVPQALLEKIIRLKKVKVNRKKIKSSYRVQEGDLVEIFDISKFNVTEKKPILKYKPSKKEIETYNDHIIEDNDNFLIVNKPSGIPVQSGTKSFRNIIDLLRDTKSFLKKKPYIVHRIDKDTSGLLIIAKNREFAQLFTSLFRIRKIHKTYLAITYGKISKTIRLLKDDLIYFDGNKKITQKAITNIKVIKSNEKFSLVELNPITGRKHQLRKQLLNIGHPIVGDDKYFIVKKKSLKQLMLHAYKIKFIINDLRYNFKARYPLNFEDFLEKNFKFY